VTDQGWNAPVPLQSPRNFLVHRSLIGQMVAREIVGRYKGSVLGLTWSILHPILMLAVYTFVFSVVMRARWNAPSADDSRTQFALLLFAGMIVHSFFSEVLTRAPGLIVGNVNYVKKVVFPLEILPVVTTLVALFHVVVSLSVLLLAFALFNHHLHWTAALAPLVLLPLLLVNLGVGWMLASLGVYSRDLGQVVGLASTVLLFLSPVFYPVSSLPAAVQPWMLINPLTFIIEQMRAVVIWGQAPDWAGLGLYAVLSALFAWAGFLWFQKTRRGFADVI
jgi:lipopolysaccharide transport system permease protein